MNVSSTGWENQGPIRGRVCPVPRVRLWQVQGQNSQASATDFFPPSWAWVRTGRPGIQGHPGAGTGCCITNSGDNFQGKQQKHSISLQTSGSAGWLCLAPSPPGPAGQAGHATVAMAEAPPRTCCSKPLLAAPPARHPWPKQVPWPRQC